MRKGGQYAVALALLLMLCAFFYPADNGELGEKVFAIRLPALFAGEVRAVDDLKWLKVYDTASRSVRNMDLEEYVLGVVLAEMPVDYADEAIKAQAVAARTYAVNKSARFGGGGCAARPGADICTAPGCCQGYIDLSAFLANQGARAEDVRRVAQLVSQVAGELITYNGAPIQAMYHACAGGQTENAEDVYSQALAYLRGVPSPGESAYPQYSARKTMGFTALKAAFQGVNGARLSPNLSLSDQLEILAREDSGRVRSIRVGLAVLTGAQFRALAGLNSSSFDMQFTGNAVIFSTKGFGHGVGMSQTGADAMARAGKTYLEILNWYYTGVTIENQAEPLALGAQ